MRRNYVKYTCKFSINKCDSDKKMYIASAERNVARRNVKLSRVPRFSFTYWVRDQHICIPQDARTSWRSLEFSGISLSPWKINPPSAGLFLLSANCESDRFPNFFFIVPSFKKIWKNLGLLLEVSVTSSNHCVEVKYWNLFCMKIEVWTEMEIFWKIDFF